MISQLGIKLNPDGRAVQALLVERYNITEMFVSLLMIMGTMWLKTLNPGETTVHLRAAKVRGHNNEIIGTIFGKAFLRYMMIFKK